MIIIGQLTCVCDKQMQSAIQESVEAITTLGKDNEPLPPALNPSTVSKRRRHGVTRCEEEEEC